MPSFEDTSEVCLADRLGTFGFELTEITPLENQDDVRLGGRISVGCRQSLDSSVKLGFRPDQIAAGDGGERAEFLLRRSDPLNLGGCRNSILASHKSFARSC